MFFKVSNIDVLQGVIKTMNLGSEKNNEKLHYYGFSSNEYKRRAWKGKLRITSV